MTSSDFDLWTEELRTPDPTPIREVTRSAFTSVGMLLAVLVSCVLVTMAVALLFTLAGGFLNGVAFIAVVVGIVVIVRKGRA